MEFNSCNYHATRQIVYFEFWFFWGLGVKTPSNFLMCILLQVTAILSLAAACSSAGVTVLYSRDLNYCGPPAHLPCSRFQIAVAFAFISWFLLAVSSIVMFWLLGAVWVKTYTTITANYIILQFSLVNICYTQNKSVLLRTPHNYFSCCLLGP